MLHIYRYENSDILLNNDCLSTDNEYIPIGMLSSATIINSSSPKLNYGNILTVNELKVSKVDSITKFFNRLLNTKSEPDRFVTIDSASISNNIICRGGEIWFKNPDPIHSNLMAYIPVMLMCIKRYIAQRIIEEAFSVGLQTYFCEKEYITVIINSHIIRSHKKLREYIFSKIIDQYDYKVEYTDNIFSKCFSPIKIKLPLFDTLSEREAYISNTSNLVIEAIKKEESSISVLNSTEFITPTVNYTNEPIITSVPDSTLYYTVVNNNIESGLLYDLLSSNSISLPIVNNQIPFVDDNDDLGFEFVDEAPQAVTSTENFLSPNTESINTVESLFNISSDWINHVNETTLEDEVQHIDEEGNPIFSTDAYNNVLNTVQEIQQEITEAVEQVVEMEVEEVEAEEIIEESTPQLDSNNMVPYDFESDIIIPQELLNRVAQRRVVNNPRFTQ